MGFLKQINNMLLALAGMALISVATGCSDTDEPVPVPDGDGPIVTLRLSVGINSPQQLQDSRAAGEYPAGYPYDFEPAATIYEGISTLRVIVVRPDNTVEGNARENFADYIPQEGNLYGPLQFRVKSDEVKRVYLIANEASIVPAIDWTQYAVGSTLTPAAAERLLQYNEWPTAPADTLAIPYIDNTGADKKYVPMSEFFDTFVEAPPASLTEDIHTQSATYFITRNVVKFGFTISAQDKNGNPTTPVNSFRVKSLAFRNLMQKSYVFPYETSYLPTKASNTTDFRRVVTAFTTPGLNGNLVRPYYFPIEALRFGVNATGSSYAATQTYAPELYFSETFNNTAGNRFDIDVELEIEGDKGPTVKFYRVKLPNLPDFPRNTFVKVNLIMQEELLTAVVDVVPYISVSLNPIFGFQQIKPTEPESLPEYP